MAGETSCVVCEKPFVVTGRKKTCSTACAKELQRRTRREREGTGAVPCGWCGKPMLRQHNRKGCTDVCRAELYRKYHREFKRIDMVDPARRAEVNAMRRERRADQVEQARKRERDRYARRRADPAEAERMRKYGRRNWAKTGAAKLARRRTRMESMTEASLLRLIERSRAAGREHAARRRQNPAYRERMVKYVREWKRRRRARNESEAMKALAGELARLTQSQTLKTTHH